MKHRLRLSPSSLRPHPSLVVLGYERFVRDVASLLETARHQAARSVNAILTATYWEIGRRIVEFEQKGMRRAEYGEELLQHLSADLTARFGRGFSFPNINRFRQFYLAYPTAKILSTVSRESVGRTGETARVSATQLPLSVIARAFPLSWSHYALLIGRSRSPEAMTFYNTEALRGGWSVRQLERQIESQFYERTLLSRNKVAMLRRGGVRQPSDVVTPDEEIKDPYVLEFLNLKDEYSETELEAALIRHLETPKLGQHIKDRPYASPEHGLEARMYADSPFTLCPSPFTFYPSQFTTALPTEERLVAELERTQRLLARRIRRKNEP